MNILVQNIDEETYYRLVILKVKTKSRSWREFLKKVSKLKPQILLKQ